MLYKMYSMQDKNPAQEQAFCNQKEFCTQDFLVDSDEGRQLCAQVGTASNLFVAKLFRTANNILNHLTAIYCQLG